MRVNRISSIVAFAVKLKKWAARAYASNLVRTMHIARQREAHLNALVMNSRARAIVVIVPGRDIVNGGIMSNISIARETEKLQSLHGADVFVCTCPGDPPLLRYTKFPNDRILFDFQSILARFDSGTEILVHIPENEVSKFYSHSAPLLVAKTMRWRFNVLLQNIDMLPHRSDIAALEKIGTVTVTTAHESYANENTRKQLGCPIHHLSAWPSPFKFERRPFAERENILVISPDLHERKRQILSSLRSRLPDFLFITVRKMAYVEYRELIAKAKFSLTFGEGHDGYFSEIIQGGGIGCAVFNERFFTEDFSSLPFVYPSWDELLSRLPDDIHATNVADEFARQSEIAYRVLSKESSAERFQENLFSYYEKYFPASSSAWATSSDRKQIS